MFITNMLITDIVPMDKKRKRIILEDSSSFCLYNKEIKNLELEIDDQITEEKWIKIEEILEKRAKERVLYLLNDMDKTEYEVSEKLKAGGFMAFAFDCKCFIGTIFSVMKGEGVVEGGTGKK